MKINFKINGIDIEIGKVYEVKLNKTCAEEWDETEFIGTLEKLTIEKNNIDDYDYQIVLTRWKGKGGAFYEVEIENVENIECLQDVECATETPQEDLANWINRNWDETVKETIWEKLEQFSREQLNISDVVERDVLIDDLSEEIKEGILNVIATYEENNYF